MIVYLIDLFFFAKKLMQNILKSKVFAISGSNFFNRTIKNDFFFSKYNHCWGWQHGAEHGNTMTINLHFGQNGNIQSVEIFT